MEVIAGNVNKATDQKDLVKTLEPLTADFLYEGDINVFVPCEGSGAVCIDNNTTGTISMKLPDEVNKTKGVQASDGTVVYNSGEDVNMAIQVLNGTIAENTISVVRSLLSIENADAPKEYSFKYSFPVGYQLIADTEYFEKYADDFDKAYYNKNGFSGEVYIIDGKNNIVQTIDLAWAKDAKGHEINTYYKVKGNELIQVVDFDDNSQFPIIADPTVHPRKISKIYLTKTQVEEMAKMYEHQKSSSWWNVPGCIDGVAEIFAKNAGKAVRLTGRLAKIGHVFLAVSCYLTAMDIYYGAKASEMKKFAKQMKKGQYLRSINYEIWRNGKNGGYYHSPGECKIVNKKNA